MTIRDNFIDQYILDEFGTEAQGQPVTLDQIPLAVSNSKLYYGDADPTPLALRRPIGQNDKMIQQSQPNGLMSQLIPNYQPQQISGYQQMYGNPPVKYEVSAIEAAALPKRTAARRKQNDYDIDAYWARRYIMEHGANYGADMVKQMAASNSPTLMKKAMKFGDEAPGKSGASTDAIRNYQFREGLAPNKIKTEEGKARQAQFDQMRDRRLYNTGQAWQPGYGKGPNMPINPTVAQQPGFRANVITSEEQARDKQAQFQQKRQQAEMASLSKVITNNAREIVESMSSMQFGYVPGMLPNVTGESQALESMLSNLIPTVIESLGPGPKSDSDLLLLERMLPHMGMEKSELLKALDRFDAKADQIIDRSNGGQKPLSTKEQERLMQLRKKYGR